MRRVSLVLSFALSISACAQVGGQVAGMPAPGFTRLSTDEIRRTIIGRSLTHDVQRAHQQGWSAITTPYRERFLDGGRIEVTHHRAGMSGRYSIANGQLCITLLHQQRECRHIFRDVNGAFLQRYVSNPMEITPIVIE